VEQAIKQKILKNIAITPKCGYQIFATAFADQNLCKTSQNRPISTHFLKILLNKGDSLINKLTNNQGDTNVRKHNQ
jgi:hypothetical protein